MIMSYRSSTVKGSTTSNFYTMQGHRSVGRRSLSAKSQAIGTIPLIGTSRLRYVDPWLRDNQDMGTPDRSSPPLWLEHPNRYIATLKSQLATVVVRAFEQVH